jgi:predicted Ser/Thr protein kinase
MEYIDAADGELRDAYEEPTSLAAFVEGVLADPSLAAHASKYVLDAIEDAGTRTVVEEGEERERYRFFDDPSNDGEHAVLGNTGVLNDLVEDLRAVAAGGGDAERILWVAGPTATGKSELKRCLINGLREYSRRPAGRRYTVEWNVAGAEESPGLTYGRGDADAGEWRASPVQANPLSVFPEATRRDLVADANEGAEDIPVQVPGDLDPYSRVAYRHLADRYRERHAAEPFAAVADPDHLRVVNYVVDVGRGIGVLHAEDDGTPRERLVGSWMGELFGEFAATGQKNPQAFAYDGVLSQGNGVLTVVEEAAQHADLLGKLLNVPDERVVKVEKGIRMDLDTQLLVISNPDLTARLNEHADRQGRDPLRALKRRLSKHRVGYLTNRSLEAELLHRELTDETAVWEPADEAARTERVRERLAVTVRTGEGARERELAPHAVEAAALYAVVTRLDATDLPEEFDLVEKALLFDRGYVERGDERIVADDLDIDSGADGTNGIPVTYTRDAIADLLQGGTDRTHPDLAVGDVLMPDDVLDAMVAGLAEAPLFSDAERAEFDGRVVPVREYVLDRQEADVLAAMLRDRRPEAAAVEEYVASVYAWATDESITNDRGERVDPDPLAMKVFETDHLGFDADDYDGTHPPESVVAFREEEVVAALNRRAWERRDEEFRVAGVDPASIPGVADSIEAFDWADVARVYPDFDPSAWADPPADTETAAVKELTVENLVDHAGYTPASAELTGRRVLREVAHRWD